MSKSKSALQDLVKEINKLAAPPPPPPTGGGGTVTTAPPSGGTTHPAIFDAPHGSVPIGGGNVAVKSMQQELINLAQAVRAQMKLEDLAHKPGEAVDVRKQQEAVGRGSFGDFITKHYLRTSDVPGTEFDPDPSKQKMEQKKPSDPTRLSVVMDTMERIGNPKGGEFAADGVWGPRTNAALRNAYALAFGLLKLASDFKLPLTAYNGENLVAFKNMLPEDHTSLDAEQKAEVAPELSKHLKAIQRMYQEIKDGILEKPAYRAFIEADKPFVTYQKKGPTLNQQQVASLQKTFANGFPVKYKNEAKVISVNDLLSMNALKSWQQQNVPDMPLQNLLVQLKNLVAQSQ